MSAHFLGFNLVEFPPVVLNNCATLFRLELTKSLLTDFKQICQAKNLNHLNLSCVSESRGRD